MKYYTYISDVKIDMLFPQVPHEIKKKVATEFGIDLKLLTLSRKNEVETEENRITRLETVISFLREYGRLGSIDEPDEYFEGVLPMGVAVHRAWPDQDDIVYWSGQTELTMLGLGGSSRHMFGGRVGLFAGGSTSYFIIQFLNLLAKQPGGVDQVLSIRNQEKALGEIESLAKEEPFHPERMEFVAKRLIHSHERLSEQKSSSRVLLGTPLYVAKAD